MLADIIGRKISRVIGVVLYLFYIILVVFSGNVLFIGLAFIICGASYAFESGSGEAMIYDSLLKTNDQENYMKISGNREIIYQLSSSMAILIGGYIALTSYNLNFFVVFIAFVTALIPILLMKETKTKKVEKDQNIRDLLYEHFILSTKTVFNDRNLTFLIFIGAFIAAPITSVFFYFQLYLTDTLLFSPSIIGILLASHSVAGALGGYFAAQLEKKYQEKLLLYIVPLFIVISFWVIQVDFLIFVPFVLLGFLDSILYIVLSDYINRIVPSEQRATVISFNSLVFSIVMIFIFPLLGYIGQSTGFKFSFLILAILVSLLYLMLLYILNKTEFKLEKD